MSRAGSRIVPFALALSALPAQLLTADDWSRFRGANGAGVSAARGLPVEFSPQKNVDWAVDVPFGRSSPVLAGDRVYLTAVEDGRLLTLALDRDSGKRLWSRALERGEKATMYHGNDSATPTPASDGTNVYVLFHELGVVSYDGEGRERWRHALGPLRNFYGLAASPVLAGDRLIVLCDQAIGSFVLALDKDSGRELWRTERKGRRESYTTPVLYPSDSAPRELVVYGSRHVDAYDLATGKLAWTHGGVSSAPVASPLLVDDLLFVAGVDQQEEGVPPFAGEAAKHDTNRDGCLDAAEVAGSWITQHFGYVDLDGGGCITAEEWNVISGELATSDWGVFAIRLGQDAPKVVWNYRKNVSYIPSPLVYDGVFYMAKDGIVTSLDPRTGEPHKRDRLSREDKIKVYASPVAADGKVYFAGLEGKLAVLRAGAQWDVVAVNDLGDEIHATPAIAGNSLYVRTKGRVYRFTQQASAPTR